MQSLFYGTEEEKTSSSNPSYIGGSQAHGASFGSGGGLGMGNPAVTRSSQGGPRRVPGGLGGASAGQSTGTVAFAQDVGFHIETAFSVKEYAYTEDKNRQFRPDMEDTQSHMDRVGGDANTGLFAVFDGHGGKQVAEHCAETFPIELRKELQKAPTDLYQMLEQVFIKVDGQIAMLDSDHCGSTACVAIIRREINHNVLYVANVGDTRAVISKNGTAERLSVDHKATDPKEIDRVKSEGGTIMDNRVAGGLAITRALGDHAYKSFGVTASPYVVRHVLRPFDKFLIMGSDGIWDTVTDEQAVALCNEDHSTKEIVEAIVRLALDKGSTDNISCMVIRFNSNAIF